MEKQIKVHSLILNKLNYFVVYPYIVLYRRCLPVYFMVQVLFTCVSYGTGVLNGSGVYLPAGG